MRVNLQTLESLERRELRERKAISQSRAIRRSKHSIRRAAQQRCSVVGSSTTDHESNPANYGDSGDGGTDSFRAALASFPDVNTLQNHYLCQGGEL